MGKHANSAGRRPGDDTRRKSAAAALLAAFWPSRLGPDHEAARRALNHRIWRRRVSRVALVAAIGGIGAVAAAPPFHKRDGAQAAQTAAGAQVQARRTAATGDGGEYAGGGFVRRPLGWRPAHGPSGAAPAPPPQAPLSADNVEDHAEDAVQGPHEFAAPPFWERASYSPTLGHSVGGSGGGGSHGGGSAGDGGSGASGPSGSDGVSPDNQGGPDQQTGSKPPGEPQPPGAPPYVVDPDDGPHQPGDPPWPGRWPPRTLTPDSPLSPVPEPRTWLMMIAGFAVIGASLRAQRASARTAG